MYLGFVLVGGPSGSNGGLAWVHGAPRKESLNDRRLQPHNPEPEADLDLSV